MEQLFSHRGTGDMAPADVEAVVRALVSATPELRGRDQQRMAQWVAQSAQACDGYDASDDPLGGGYWQVIGTYAAVLLRLGGASAEAALGEVARRDATQLELLVRAVLVRLAQLQERGEPTGLSTFTGRSQPVGATVPAPEPPSAVARDAAAPRAAMLSVPSMASPFGAPAATSAASPPVQYLLGLLDADARRRLRDFDPARFGAAAAAPPVPHADAFDERDISEVRAVQTRQSSTDDVETPALVLTLDDGVKLVVRPDRIAAFRVPSERAALLRKVASELERLSAGLEGGR